MKALFFEAWTSFPKFFFIFAGLFILASIPLVWIIDNFLITKREPQQSLSSNAKLSTE